MPNGHHIQSIGTTNINWPTLPNTAIKAHILPDLNPHSLVSIGILCDHDCTQPSPNTPSPSTITINPYLPDCVSQTAFGASLSTTTKPNTTPTHSLLLRHNNNWSNGFMQLPPVPVLALSLTQSNATSSQLGQASPPTSSDAISPHPMPLLKATLTNNDNANANILVPMNNQSLQAVPALTPSTPPFLTPRPPLAAPTATSPAAFRSNQIAAPTKSL